MLLFQPELNSLILSNRTKITLQRIEDSLIISDNVAESGGPANSDDKQVSVTKGMLIQFMSN